MLLYLSWKYAVTFRSRLKAMGTFIFSYGKSHSRFINASHDHPTHCCDDYGVHQGIFSPVKFRKEPWSFSVSPPITDRVEEMLSSGLSGACKERRGKANQTGFCSQGLCVFEFNSNEFSFIVRLSLFANYTHIFTQYFESKYKLELKPTEFIWSVCVSLRHAAYLPLHPLCFLLCFLILFCRFLVILNLDFCFRDFKANQQLALCFWELCLCVWYSVPFIT